MTSGRAGYDARRAEARITFPAWFGLHRDKVMQRHPAAITVYASIVCLDEIFWKPRAIKTWLLAEGLGMEKKTVRESLNLLVTRGYLVEHERADNRVRCFTVATTRERDNGNGEHK